MRKALFSSGSDDRAAEINIGPLLDMVFILLIFFVITTTFSRQTGIDVNKPSAVSVHPLSKKTVLIGVSKEGTIHLHGKMINIETLEEMLRRERERRPDLEAVIIGDRQSPLGKSIEVLDVCTKVGIVNASVAAEEKL